MADNVHKCKADDPNRCQGGTAFGQCNNLSNPGMDTCPMHSGAVSRLKREAVNGFLISQWQSRLSELADDNGVKSLRTEVGVMKLLLESLMNRCKTHDDLIEHSSKLGDLVSRSEKVVLSCNRLERSTGMMLDKSAALHIAGTIVQIISDNISDTELVSKIADQIITQVLNVNFIAEDA